MAVETVRVTLDLAGGLHAVLDGEPGHGTLEVHYQPVVGVASGHPLGAEALARWRHPQHGLLPPDTFVAAAERAGFGPRLDAQVLRTALSQVTRWDAGGCTCTASA